jgi:hypothetical protein
LAFESPDMSPLALREWLRTAPYMQLLERATPHERMHTILSLVAALVLLRFLVRVSCPRGRSVPIAMSLSHTTLATPSQRLASSG